MPFLFVEHDRRLKVAKANALPPLPAEIEALSHAGTTVVACRSGTLAPARVLKSANALQRFPTLKAEALHFHGIESDSPLAPLWLWDIAHACPVGSTLTFSGDNVDRAWLRRRYFAQSLRVASLEGDRIVFRKTAPLPAECDHGLDRWSFCIPVGPGDPTQLNATVGRILRLEIPDVEVLLCGTPGEGFRYRDRVRIIGEDLPATPLIPGLKKNMLAEAASHGNLCILHDRVFLPRSFLRAVKAFGDIYPITTFQSLYFDDRLNLDYRRYSDLHKIGISPAQMPTGIARSDGHVSPFAPAARAAFESSRISHGNAFRFDRDRQYVTGSMYLCKRAVWLKEPQSSTLGWGEFEDVEHGLRASAAGIPSRINPHAITQSVSGRTLFSYGGFVTVDDAHGRRRESRARLGVLPLPRKPLLRQPPAVMSANLHTFLARHADDPPTNPKWSRFTGKTTGRQRLHSIADALQYARNPTTERECRALIGDFEKLLLGDQLPYSRTEQLVSQFRRKGQEAFAQLVTVRDLLNQVAQRPGKGVFAMSASSAFPKKGFALLVGTAITALLITVSRRQPVVYVGGYWRLLREILDTSPADGTD